jgi:hypothetical protein
VGAEAQGRSVAAGRVAETTSTIQRQARAVAASAENLADLARSLAETARGGS